MKTTPVILLILDGFGYRKETQDNAIALANTPNLDALKANYPNTLINASEHYVGLPDGQMGNSEVGHLNIGAGRIVFQDFERINNSITSGEFFQHPKLCKALQQLKATNKALHIFGLLSNGGVHSHQDHIHAMLEMAAKQGLSKVYVHAFLDGRDTPPVSAAPVSYTHLDVYKRQLLYTRRLLPWIKLAASKAKSASLAASVTAVGKPRTSSAAKLGPESAPQC